MLTSSSRVRSSCLRSRSVVVGAAHTRLEVVAEGEDRGAFVGGQRGRAGGLAAGQLGLGGGERGRAVSHSASRPRATQPVVGVDRGSGVRRWLRCSGRVRPRVATGPARCRGRVRVAGRRPGRRAGRPGERGQERLGHGGVDTGPAHAQVPRAAAVDELAAAGAVVARGGAAARRSRPRACARTPAAGQPLQQRGPSAPRRCPAGAPGPGVGADAGLVGLVGVPVDEPAMMVGDEHLPVGLGERAAAGAQHPVVADIAFGAGAPNT